jgi:putative DNA primase/helicase
MQTMTSLPERKELNPRSRPFSPDNIPVELREREQWVCWKLEPRQGKDGMTKVPYSATDGRRASCTAPGTWSSFSVALRAVDERGYDGVGFFFSRDDPYVGIDLDNALDENGEVKPAQLEVLRGLGSYTELSQSGKGLHVILKGETPGNQSMKCGNAFGEGEGLEIYPSDRFFIMTGNRLDELPPSIQNDTGKVEELFERYRPIQARPLEEAPSQPQLTMDDESLIQRAMRAKNGEKFKRLWDGDTSGYPSQSEAEAAFCALLVFWTRDPGQIDRLYRKSGLFRTKWNERHGSVTYGARTIEKAVSLVSERYSDRGPLLTKAALTDMGNGDRLVRTHGRRLRFCEPLGGWHVWDGVKWQEDKENRAMALAKEAIRRIYEEAAEEPDESRRREISKHALASERAPRVHAMLDMAKPDLALLPEKLDADPWVLNCPNGLLDLRNGDLLNHTPEDMVSRVTNVDYNPGASRNSWEKFLYEIFAGRQGLIRFIKKAVGYSLTGLTVEQCLFILHGEGANGKSTFLEALANALGDYAGTASPETFLMTKLQKNVGDDIAALKGSRLVTTSETGRGRRMDEARVKQLSGGDTVSCRKLFGDFFSYKPTWKIWMATNHMPKFDSTDHALFRRLRLIPFDVTIPTEKQDKGLLDRLKEEAEGILAWAVEGARLWQEEGLESPEEVRVATEGYRSEQDSLGRFLEEECTLTDQGKTTVMDFKKAYESWCDETGESGIGKNEIGRYLVKRGVKRKKTGGQWYFFGVSLGQCDGCDPSDLESESLYKEKSVPNLPEITSPNVTTSHKIGYLDLGED